MKKLNVHSEQIKIAFIFVITLGIGVITFLLNNIVGLLNAILYFIQVFVGVIFGLWYLRVFISYLREFRKKDVKKQLGIPKGWAVFGLIAALLNFLFWFLLSSLLFNFPKIIFLVPSVFALVQIGHTFSTAKRRKARDWFLLLYNVFAFLYLLNWTLVDFGVDLPTFLGIFSHTINTSAMWWQILFLNTNAFFVPTFLFPPYMLNPRYYFAIPVEEYYLWQEEKKPIMEYEEKLTRPLSRKSYTTKGVRIQKKELPGERKPFFEERKKLKEYEAELEAIRKELGDKKEDEDTKYAEFVGSNDFPFQLRKVVNGLDRALRNVSIGIILVLVVVTPVVFAGTISITILEPKEQVSFHHKPGMVLAVSGSVFSTFNSEGNVSSNWSEQLDEEISLAKELAATHLRYDLPSNALQNNYTKAVLSQGFQRIKAEGLKLILNVEGQFSSTKEPLFSLLTNDSRYIALHFQPDYMIIFNELNGKVQSLTTELLTKEELFNALQNTSTLIKNISPPTKVVSTLLALRSGFELFQKLLTNSTLNIDVVGITYYPIFFNWRFNLLHQYGLLYNSTNTTKGFWLSETGVNSFNFGETAQERYLVNILSLGSTSSALNLSGICIATLFDNAGLTINNGVIRHLGLVYYNGKKKKAFEAVGFAFKKIQAII